MLKAQHQEIDWDQDHNRRNDPQSEQSDANLALQLEGQAETGDRIGAERSANKCDDD
jgi:hypothetical protein